MNAEMTILVRLQQFWLCGAIGGLLHHLMERRGALALPSYVKASNELRLGFIAALALGVGSAILVDHTHLTAVVAGLCFPYVLERISQLGIRFFQAEFQRKDAAP
jgi:hypothetical protein